MTCRVRNSSFGMDRIKQELIPKNQRGAFNMYYNPIRGIGHAFRITFCGAAKRGIRGEFRDGESNLMLRLEKPHKGTEYPTKSSTDI